MDDNVERQKNQVFLLQVFEENLHLAQVFFVLSEGSCEMVNNCDPNADCVADPQSARQVCRCREGFAGDGTRCTLSSAMNGKYSFQFFFKR